MRHLTIAITIGALCLNCGGGGGAPAGGGGGGGVLTGAALIESILKDCGADTFLETIAVINAMLAVLDPAGVNPAFTVTDIVQPNTIFWSLDIDNDGTEDFLGGFQFIDPDGMPFAPFDLNQFASSLAALDTQIGAMPNGAQIQIDVVGTGASLGGGFGLLFNGGVPTLIDGQFNGVVGDCGGTFQLVGVSIAAFTVTGNLESLIDSADGGVEGDAALDGTNTLTVTLTVAGEPDEFTFLIDKTTGAVTRAP